MRFERLYAGRSKSDKFSTNPIKNEQLLESTAEVLKKAQSSRSWDAIATDHAGN